MSALEVCVETGAGQGVQYVGRRSGPRSWRVAEERRREWGGAFSVEDRGRGSDRALVAEERRRGSDGERGGEGERAGEDVRPGRSPRHQDHQDDSDALQGLGDEIATLAAHIHAATHRLLSLIAEFDERGGWKTGGFRSCAHWLAFRTGIDLGAAREKVRAARALVGLPRIGGSMARGELSFAKVRALTRVATAENEEELLDYARATTAAGLERVVRSWKRYGRLDEQEAEKARHSTRCLSVFPDDEGMYLVRGRLDPEVGALLMRAIDAATDALFARERWVRTAPKDRAGRAKPAVRWAGRAKPEGRAGGSRTVAGVLAGGAQGAADVESALTRAMGLSEPPELETTPKQRRADAIGLLAERALAVGMDCESDDAATTATPSSTPVSGSRAERYQVVLHVSAETLNGSVEPERSELEDGTRVSAETSRRLACDSSVVRLLERGGDGGSSPGDGVRTRHAVPGQEGSLAVLDVGRKTRTIPPAIRRALEARDRGCRFPGCGLRFTDAHHLRHWADGGETRLDNLILLCRRHHRAVHEEGFRLEIGPTGRPNFYTPRGMPLAETPRITRTGASPVETLMRRNRERGIDPGFFTAKAEYRREADVPWRTVGAALEGVAGSRGVAESAGVEESGGCRGVGRV